MLSETMSRCLLLTISCRPIAALKGAGGSALEGKGDSKIGLIHPAKLLEEGRLPLNVRGCL